MEHFFTNGSYAVGDDNRCQVGATQERLTANAGDAVRDDDRGQVGATRERRIANSGDAIGDDNRCQVGAPIEPTNANGGDRQALIAVDNFDIGSGAAILSHDRIGAVIRNLVDHALGSKHQPTESTFIIVSQGMPHCYRKPLLLLAKSTNTHLHPLCGA